MGVERAVRDTGYALRVVNTMEGERAGIAGAVDSLLDQGVDGIVISEPIDEADGADLLRTGRRAGPRPRRTPALRRPPCGDGRHRLQPDGAGGHRAPAGAGHATVHHLAGPQRWYSARDRLDGWREALAAHWLGRAAGRRG